MTYNWQALVVRRNQTNTQRKPNNQTTKQNSIKPNQTKPNRLCVWLSNGLLFLFLRVWIIFYWLCWMIGLFSFVAWNLNSNEFETNQTRFRLSLGRSPLSTLWVTLKSYLGSPCNCVIVYEVRFISGEYQSLRLKI